MPNGRTIFYGRSYLHKPRQCIIEEPLIVFAKIAFSGLTVRRLYFFCVLFLLAFFEGAVLVQSHCHLGLHP